MVVARNDTAHRALADQFRSRTVQKTYLALVHGSLARDSGAVTLPIGRDPRRRTRMTARLRSGRQARTDWRVLLRLGKHFTLVEAGLHTGRTHQIRAHFSAIGHPLVGDSLYGAPQRARAGGVDVAPLGRVFLHAARLAFVSPRTGKAVEVRAPLDMGLQAYLRQVSAATAIAPREVDAALSAYL
jgi:23S rRNA pseudouridine1911/1915/1917 synthase